MGSVVYGYQLSTSMEDMVGGWVRLEYSILIAHTEEVLLPELVSRQQIRGIHTDALVARYYYHHSRLPMPIEPNQR